MRVIQAQFLHEKALECKQKLDNALKKIDLKAITHYERDDSVDPIVYLGQDGLGISIVSYIVGVNTLEATYQACCEKQLPVANCLGPDEVDISFFGEETEIVHEAIISAILNYVEDSLHKTDPEPDNEDEN